MTPDAAAAATEAAWRLHHRAVVEMLARRARSHHLAEDLAAETFVRLLRYLSDDTNTHPEHLRAWLFTVARNLLVDHVKTPSAQRELLSDEPSGPGGEHLAASERHVSIETWQSALELLEMLPEHQRMVVILRGLKDMSIAETADHLGMTPQAVRYLKHAAKRRLAVERERFALGDSILDPQAEPALEGTTPLGRHRVVNQPCAADDASGATTPDPTTKAAF